MTSDPPGARLQVFQDKRLTADATTPASILVRKGSDVTLQLQRPGQPPVRVQLDRSISGGFLADLWQLSPVGIIVDLASGAAWKHQEAVDLSLASELAPPAKRDLRLTVALLAGTGYGWTSGTGDVNRDARYSGYSSAGLGHLVPEIGVLSVRERMFLSVRGRYQVVEGATDVYSAGRVYRTRRTARAVFSKFGWLLRAPEHRIRPYVSLAWGWGQIVHLAPLPPLLCGPQNDQPCVDTITFGHWFLGAGGGLQWGLTEHLHAVLALDVQVSVPQRNYNADIDVGLATVF